MKKQDLLLSQLSDEFNDFMCDIYFPDWAERLSTELIEFHWKEFQCWQLPF
jgi:hypothetical protein